MATMLDDFLHMNVEGADTMRGLRLLEVKQGVVDVVASPVVKLLASISFPWCSPTVAMGPRNAIVDKILEYSERWQDVPYNERRDVIGALKAGTKIGLTAAKIVSLLV